MTQRWRMLGCRGCGSAIVESVLVIAGLPYEREEVDYTQKGPARDRLLALNPLGQVPTVVLPGGKVMSESAAIILHIDETHPAACLLPKVGDPLRSDALRWLIFVVSAIYPTFTYGDEPEKWIGDAGPMLREATHAHRRALWKQLESVTGAPWFLGETRSALDLYIGVMTHWRPRRDWFEAECPKLFAIAKAIDADPRLTTLWAANFD
ncbi:MAG: glutathione S-transferase family protein [Deltaproteobacteria bacterium]|nr:glutathione S-transferase family protein [Deltaproteobacteria bacterium]